MHIQTQQTDQMPSLKVDVLQVRINLEVPRSARISYQSTLPDGSRTQPQQIVVSESAGDEVSNEAFAPFAALLSSAIDVVHATRFPDGIVINEEEETSVSSEDEE